MLLMCTQTAEGTTTHGANASPTAPDGAANRRVAGPSRGFSRRSRRLTDYGYGYDDDDWSDIILFGDEDEDDLSTSGGTDGYGQSLDDWVKVDTWTNQFYLQIVLTMPDDLDDIGDWDGLLGSDDGNHMYPYFNEDGLWFEQQSE